MKVIKTVMAVLTAAMVFTTCEDDAPSSAKSDRKPEPTAIGTPIEIPVTAMIGEEGGTVSSGDGRVELQIPPAALRTSTEITVQAITNTAPGGRGKAYRFGPDGSAFDLPVTLTMHYTSVDIEGTLPTFLGIAFQDDDGVWYSLRNFVWNTVDQTITTTTSHFTDFATFADLHIASESGSLKVNNSGEFTVVAVNRDQDFLAELTPPKDGDDELAPLYPQKEVPASMVKSWAANGVVNGDAKNGTIAPSGSHCTYTAPAAKPVGPKNPVQLSADIDMKYKDPSTGQSFNKLTLVEPVEILSDNGEFKVTMNYGILAYTLVGISEIMANDKVEFTVTVENGIVSVSDIVNYPTALDSQGGLDLANCSSTVEPDPYDVFKVASGTGQLIADVFESTMVGTALTTEQTVAPKWKFTCPGNDDPLYLGGETLPVGIVVLPLFPLSLESDTTIVVDPMAFTIKPQ